VSDRTGAPAIDGWYTLDENEPHLIGSRCAACGTYSFPPRNRFCPNPGCGGTELQRAPLSRTGILWSYTNACYQPPEPYISADPFLPFAIAAVALEKEKMIVLGQVVTGVGVEQLRIGMPMQLVLETLYEEPPSERVVWKWKPAEGGA
jgi:uncharacterized OB-fold protein